MQIRPTKAIAIQLRMKNSRFSLAAASVPRASDEAVRCSHLRLSISHPCPILPHVTIISVSDKSHTLASVRTGGPWCSAIGLFGVIYARLPPDHDNCQPDGAATYATFRPKRPEHHHVPSRILIQTGRLPRARAALHDVRASDQNTRSFQGVLPSV